MRIERGVARLKLHQKKDYTGKFAQNCNVEAARRTIQWALKRFNFFYKNDKKTILLTEKQENRVKQTDEKNYFRRVGYSESIQQEQFGKSLNFQEKKTSWGVGLMFFCMVVPNSLPFVKKVSNGAIFWNTSSFLWIRCIRD